MNVSDLLNPLPNRNNNTKFVRTRCISTPVIPSSSSSSTTARHYYDPSQHMDLHHLHQQHLQHQNVIGKPRSRFSEYEDNIIRQGVAQRLTWGQISDLLPHRKRATCFNRYRTLQGIRKSRKLSEANSPEMSSSSSLSPASPVTSCFSDPKTPPSYTQPSWFPSSAADVIYDPQQQQQQHMSFEKYPASSYVNDINSSSSSSDSSSDDNDDFPFAVQTTMTKKRSHKISLPALTSYHHPHHRSTSASTTTSRTVQPFYSF
ncbi:Homeodomain-like DNA binding domain-containing transcription factor [Mucor lusitanicus]|uniref:Homeodomain-like DNA binding domain-containing transcription factor n=2 Tax=Mucor circinelloides f. lusitanicus TaxID=29924 RepID=A0A168PQH3_MUCCL|nr:Homeodomain-like DNA binding domain-containing transcription factor [Mucor lusitanicus]OAD08063.1 Homeodomain-like DNA binding domain-containing transcription factor [Mucor lusitanicus CBS 277.49]